MIDVTQLMIGSWVYDPINKRNCRIVALRAGYQNPPIIDNNGNGEPESSLSSCDYLDPITLTADWLERAGWFYSYGWYHMGCNFEIVETNDGWEMESPSGDVMHAFNHVHELQLLMAGLGRPLTFK